MKRFIAVLLILIFSYSVFASQLLYRADSYQVKAYKTIRRIAGDNTVEPCYPISGTQLLTLLDKISVSNLDSKGIALLNNLKQSLKEDNSKVLDYEVTLGTGAFARTSKKKISYEQLFLPLRDRGDMYGINGKLFWQDYAAGVIDMQFTRQWTNEDYNKSFYISIPDLIKHDERMPWNEYISLGYKQLNVFCGRTRFSAGNGIINNAFMGDNFLFEEGAKLSLINPKFSYDLTLLTFDPEPGPGSINSYDFHNPDLIVSNHRFSVNVFDLFTFNLYEAMLEYGNNAFNIRMLNPFMIMHNYASWAFGNNNNLFGVELSANLGRGYELNIQTMFDQIQGTDEIERDIDTDMLPPNSGALIINLVHSGLYKNGFLNCWIEGVYTSPGCYIKERYPKFHEEYSWYQVDWLFGADTDIEKQFNYLGYKYGPNCIGLNIGASYFTGKASIEAGLDYHFTGTYRKGDYINTEKQYFYKLFPYCIGEGKVFEHDIVAGIKATYNVIPGISVNGSAAYLHFINFGNRNGENFSDFQVSFGLNVDFAELLKIKGCCN